MKLNLISLITAFAIHSQAYAVSSRTSDEPPLDLNQVQSIYSERDARQVSSDKDNLDIRSSDNKTMAIKYRALSETAFTIGVKSGLANELWHIKKAIKTHERELDTIYNFGPLLIQDRVVPPVLSQANDIYTQDDDLTIRLSGSLYKIVSQARFSSVPPNWRGYLTFPEVDVKNQLMNNILFPQTSDEKKLWTITIEKGWKEGVEQADDILKRGMDRLNRDYIGMIRFHQFVMQGKISMPIIAQSKLPANTEGDSMSVDETLLRITQLPSFNSKVSTWHSTFSSQPQKSVAPQLLHTKSQRE